MKKQIIAGSCMLACAGVSMGQGLFDIAPNVDAQESSPLKWHAGLDFGYDDNVTPTAGNDDGATYINGYVGASLVQITPQTTWDVYARLGAIYYLDSIEATGTDDAYGQGRIGANWAHRVSERLRFSSRNFAAYELEPDYNFGLSGDRQIDEYLHYQSDNAVGYRWSERFGTYSGFIVRGLNYSSDSSTNDRMSYTLYNQFRYRASEQTVWTLDYRYSWTDASGSAGDSDNHYILAGIEHRFSPTAVLALKAGIQLRDVDRGASSENPFVEAALRNRINEQLSVRAFIRYSVEDIGTSFQGFTYDTNQTLRIGVSGRYIVSPKLQLSAGLSYLRTDMQDGRSVFPPVGSISDAETDLINLNVGFSYEINEGTYFTGSYNWTHSTSDLNSRDYDRNRVSLGLRVDF